MRTTPLASPTPLPFDQAWTLADTQAYADMMARRPRDEDEQKRNPPGYEAWRNNDYTPLDDRLNTACVQHLLSLAERPEGLPMPPVFEGLNLGWLNAWQRVAERQPLEAWDVSTLGRLLQGAMGSSLLAFFGDQAVDVDAKHQELQSLMAEGSFEWFWFRSEGACSKTGLRVLVETKGWAPFLGTLDPSSRGFAPLADTQIPRSKVEHVVVPVPSGELWINDMFRTPSFIAAFKQATENLPSINEEPGCVARTQALVEQLGLASVFVGNTSPRVVLDRGRLLFGHLDDGEDGDDDEPMPLEGATEQQLLGYVCTDLWWASMIDKELLLDVMARHQPREQAELELKAWEDEGFHSLVKVQVPPGTYHLYFSGDPDVFEEKFPEQYADEVGFSSFESPMFLLSPDELTPTPSARPTGARGPR